MPRYIEGVVKPHAAFPIRRNRNQSAHSAKARNVREDGVERLLQRLPAETNSLGQLVRCNGADKIFAGPGRRNCSRSVIGVCARPDQRQIPNASPALGGEAACRGRDRDMAIDIDGDRADGTVLDLIVEAAFGKQLLKLAAAFRDFEPARWGLALTHGRARTRRRPCRTGRRGAPSRAACAQG